MIAIQGTVRNGQIVLDEPAELREGTRVEVLPIETRQPNIGMREEEWPTTTEGIADLLARMDRTEPGWLPSDEDTAWRAALSVQREMEKRRFAGDADQLRRMWE